MSPIWPRTSSSLPLMPRVGYRPCRNAAEFLEGLRRRLARQELSDIVAAASAFVTARLVITIGLIAEKIVAEVIAGAALRWAGHDEGVGFRLRRRAARPHFVDELLQTTREAVHQAGRESPRGRYAHLQRPIGLNQRQVSRWFGSREDALARAEALEIVVIEVIAHGKSAIRPGI